MDFSNINLNINANLYRTFLAAYQTRNVRKASELLCLSSPTTVSHNIKLLERQLDTRLFVSSHKGIEPTAEAHEMAAELEQAFLHIKKAEEVIKPFGETTVGMLRIGVSSIISNFFFASYFSSFNKKYPKIRLSLYHNSKEELTKMLADHSIDLMLTFTSKTKKDTPETFALKKVSRVFFASEKFAEDNGLGSVITKNDLIRLPLILMPVSLGIMQTLADALQITLHPLVEVPSAELMHQFVLDDMGIGYSAEDYVDNKSDDPIIKFEFNEAPLPVSFIECSINKSTINKPALMFIKGLRNFC